ncbi:MAG: autotransporter outer membrane beta-barrel domain-containing protein [Planctomycetota bacterium]|jgi:hypothetical protein
MLPNMKEKLNILVLLMALVLGLSAAAQAEPMGTAFTYRGQLYDANYVADGLYDFQFKLYDANTDGNQVGDDVNKADVNVVDAYFAVELDFGGVFDGNEFWLEVGVRPGEQDDPCEYTFLEPLQKLTPTPYALYAKTAGAGHSLDAADGSPTDAVYVDNDGDVGIGTSTPDAQLSIQMRGKASPTIGFNAPGLVIKGGSWNEGNQLEVQDPSGNTRFVVDSAGKVGIGTDSPLSKLSVGGDGYYDTGVYSLGSTYGVKGKGDIGVYGQGSLYGVQGTDSDSDSYGRLGFGTYGVYGSGSDTGVHGVDSGSGSYGKLGYGGIGVYGAGDNYGVIGEGATYGVKGTDSNTGAYGRLGNDNWGGYFGGDGYFSGNVGIGTTSPGRQLEISNTDDAWLRIAGDSDNSAGETGNAYLQFTTDAQAEGFDGLIYLENRNADTKLHFDVEDILAMTIHNGKVGIGTTSPAEKLTVRGNLLIESSDGTDILELGEGLDYAEGFDVSDSKEISPGTVLIIDADNPGKLAMSDKAYDSKVAGIVAGAQGQGSGVRLGAGQFDYDVALAGRVYCNVDATRTAVEPGDLLTTSATPGCAMKAVDYMRAQGAILGKAMERLEKGQKGQILVLVTLQ